MKEGGDKPAERIDWAFHRALSRSATAEESRILVDLYNKHHEQYIGRHGGREKTARRRRRAGRRPASTRPNLAAWTSVARVILNLHETITRS